MHWSTDRRAACSLGSTVRQPANDDERDVHPHQFLQHRQRRQGAGQLYSHGSCGQRDQLQLRCLDICQRHLGLVQQHHQHLDAAHTCHRQCHSGREHGLHDQPVRGGQRGPHGGHSRTGAHRQLLADLHCHPTHDRLGNQRCRVLHGQLYPVGGTATTATVTSAAVSRPTGNVVTLGLGSSIPAGATVTITATGTNPPASSASSVNIAPFATVGGASTGTPETTNSVTFGSAVSSVTLTASPSVANATSTYTVTFRATNAVASGGTITLAQPNTGFSGVTGWLITDTTANWRIVGNTAGGTGSITLTVTGQSITAGDAAHRHRRRCHEPGGRHLLELHGGYLGRHRSRGRSSVHTSGRAARPA